MQGREALVANGGSRPTKTELNMWCSGRYKSPMEDFPEFLKARSKIRVTTYIPVVSLDGVGVKYDSSDDADDDDSGGSDGDDLAEDGRKKSNLLPPLEKEASFARQPRKGANHASFSEDFPEGKPLKRVSVEMDRKIVSHLKRHLNKRIQKRFDSLVDHLDYNSDADSARARSNARGHNGFDNEKTIFNSYSETGEKIQDSDKARRKTSQSSATKGDKSRRSSSVTAPITQINGVNGADGTSRPEDTGVTFTKPAPLPGIRKDSGSQAPSSRRTSVKSQDEGSAPQVNGGSPNPEQGVPSEEADVEIYKLSQVKDEEEESEEDSAITYATVSPVSTPTLTRPETRQQSHISDTEVLAQILEGNIQRLCPPDKTVTHLYITSGFSDSEAERSFMQEHLFPRLRNHFRQRGHELRVVDLHWGSKDALSDDHKIVDVMRRHIELADNVSMGINFVILLGEKYGQSLLPSEIPQEEFDLICQAALAHRDRQRTMLRTQMTEIEKTRAEREKSKSALLEDAESVANSVDHGSDDAPTSARTDLTKDEAETTTTPAVETQPLREARRLQAETNKREQQALRMLKEAEEQLPDLDLMRQWYVLDMNSSSPVYRLQNISMVFKDILRNDAVKRASAKASWLTIVSKIHQTLKTFAPQVLKDAAALRRYDSSALELEVEHLFNLNVSGDSMCLVTRTLDNVRSKLDDQSLGDYIDLVGEKTPQVNEMAYNKVMAMRKKLIKDKVPESHLATFLIEWTTGGIRPGMNREHCVYCERVCKAISELVVKNMDDTPLEIKRKSPNKVDMALEVAEHVRCAQKKARGFQGRKDILTSIKTYLKSSTRRPLIIHGKTGSGKSAVMGKTAKEIYRWFKESDQPPRVIVRMLGATMLSTNVRTLLYSLCRQLCHMYGDTSTEIPSDYKGIFNDLACRIGQASADKPLVILLDGVDKLSDEHEGRKLQWLPPELPPHVHLIVSTISDEKYGCLQSARKLLGDRDECFLEVGQLPEQDALVILEHTLEKNNRKVTDAQFELLLETFKKCPYPLFLKVALSEALSWTSYAKMESIKLGETVKKIATFRFGRLERDHGEPLVRRALGYITASRNGVTSNEMEDLLSLDDAVMDDVVSTHKPPRRRLPTLLWLRLRADMEDLLSEIRADNTKTITWAHSQIFEAADERYLAQRDKAPSYHKAMAEYFLGMWVGKPKPYTGSEKGSDRLVSTQELYFEHEDSCEDGTDRVYNLRKINELPYHLTRSQQTSVLKTSCLCNYEWMLAKLCGTSLRALLEEYQAILTAEPHEPEVRIISDVLHLSGKALSTEPRQLASQLVGRLHRIITNDNPRAPGDTKKFPNLHPLLAAAKTSSIPALIPSIECLTEPGGILFDLLSGHSEPITAFALTTDGNRALTTSKDNTMKLWDIRSGKVVKSIEGIGPAVTAVRTAKNNALAITVEGSNIKFWSLKSGKCVFEITEYVDPASVSVAAEGQLLVSVFDGSNIFRSWSVDDFSMLCEAQISDNSIHKDNSILIADTAFGDSVLHAFRSGNMATVQHARNGKILKTLQCNDKSSSIVALAMSREYFIVCCRQQYMALHEIHSMELFDAKRGTFVRSVRGCVHDNIRTVFVNLIGTHAIAVCATAQNNTSDIGLWNLETEDHKHLATHPCMSTMGACLDFRYCMTGAEGENSLRIWDLSGKVNQPVPKLKKQQGVCEIWPMIDNQRYVVAKAVHNGPISVWNVAKGKCLQSAVRIERGLTEGSDALVMRNTRLVILTDRGFSSVSDDSRPVFQTVLVYDLRLKKYIRKLPGCYIVPAPSHEYVLLDNDSLLGPSDNRSHFIIWNLVSGHALHRIKTGFKELERRRLEQGLHLVDVPKVKRTTSAMMTPWDRRVESKSARKRRQEQETEREKQRLEELRNEKDNVVEQFLVSGDQRIIVAAFYAHHLCVFNIQDRKHTQTLQTEYSMMFLHTAALTYDGSHLVHANYDEDSKISYVTLWDCVTGDVKRRLKRETNVSALAITDDASRVVIGRSQNELHIWDPMKSNSLRRIRGYEGLRFEMNSKIFLVEDGAKAVVFAGAISVWDLEKGTVLCVFTPDTRIMVCNVVLNGQLIVFGLYDKPELIILRLMGGQLQQVLEEAEGAELFGEAPDSSSDDPSGEEGQENGEEKD